MVEDSETGVHFFRIAQEAVNNAIKHSRATEVIITLSGANGVLRLQVADNGRGLSTAKASHGMGLRLMKYRAGVIGAELEIRSKRPRGVTVICTWRGKQ